MPDELFFRHARGCEFVCRLSCAVVLEVPIRPPESAAVHTRIKLGLGLRCLTLLCCLCSDATSSTWSTYESKPRDYIGTDESSGIRVSLPRLALCARSFAEPFWVLARTFNAARTCSGRIVFFAFFSQISFASLDTSKMNSVVQGLREVRLEWESTSASSSARSPDVNV